jgi:peptidoglycan/xylan/chitin deacetylase (PgdA/CDA1 family)
LQQLVYNSFSKLRGDEILLRLDSGRLRILCYHGICEDRLANEPWMPQFFVSRSRFETQLRYLRDHANVLPLAEAVQRLRGGALPARAVALTFDDGYANNLEIAYPMLRKFRMPATIFLATAYIESGDYYPFLKQRLIRCAGFNLETHPLAEYKTSPVDVVLERAAYWWKRVRLDVEQHRALRPMTVAEVQDADPEWIEFGAHSHTHCILRNETVHRRREEIEVSTRKVAEWTGRPARLFSYPNGERGDFGEVDREALRKAAVEAAVTGIAGANSPDADPLALRRYPVAMPPGEPRLGHGSRYPPST